LVRGGAKGLPAFRAAPAFSAARGNPERPQREGRRLHRFPDAIRCRCRLALGPPVKETVKDPDENADCNKTTEPAPNTQWN